MSFIQHQVARVADGADAATDEAIEVPWVGTGGIGQREAAEQGVRVVGVSNYYDYSVYADFAARAQAKGIFPLFGLEIIALLDELVQAGIKINDPGNPGKMYLCGKGITRFDPMSPEAVELWHAAPGCVRSAEAFSQSERWEALDEDAAEGCIRSAEHAYSKDGGLAVLNLFVSERFPDRAAATTEPTAESVMLSVD